MIIMETDATQEQIANVIKEIKEYGLRADVSKGAYRTVIGLVGDESKVDFTHLATLPGVKEAIMVETPPKPISTEKGTKTNIAVVGFMGIGKTTVGQLLAKKLGKKCIKMDLLIERKAGKSIPEIFQQDGEIAFRELEIEVTKEIASEKYSVIDCGGGIVLNKINIDRLKKEGIIVCLTASPSTILDRTTNDENKKPLLKGDNPALTIRELLWLRRPFYERAADITIHTSKLDIDSVVDQIINRLKEDESFNF